MYVYIYVDARVEGAERERVSSAILLDFTRCPMLGWLPLDMLLVSIWNLTKGRRRI